MDKACQKNLSNDESCRFEVVDGQYCIFHSRVANKNFYELLDIALKEKHYLEGVYFRESFSNREFKNAKLPRSHFENIKLVNIVFISCDLEEANFTSSRLSNVIFYNCNLKNAVFSSAVLEPGPNGISVHFAGTELGGVIFEGVDLNGLRLDECKMSVATHLRLFQVYAPYEESIGNWESAAKIFTAFAVRAQKDADYDSADHFLYRAATYRHMAIIRSNPLETNIIRKWLVPTFSAGFRGLVFLLNRLVWGYSYKPFNIIIGIIIVQIFFGTTIYPFIVSDRIELYQHVVNSINIFSGITDARVTDKNSAFLLAESFEALLGNILLTMFMASLVGKFARRY